MWRDDQTAGAGGGSVYADARLHWLVIDMAAEPDASLLRSLALFGVVAAPGVGDPGAHIPVLCDARNRSVTQRLIAQIPQRQAPLMFCNVSLPQTRARLLLAGADDAVSGRIAMCELAARMAVAARKSARSQGRLRLAGFVFDIGLRQVRRRGWRLPVMPREFDLLLELARHCGAAVSRQALLQSVWNTAFDPGTNSVEVHICKLRRHLGPLADTVRIDTVKGGGYRLVTSDGPDG